MPGDGLTPLDQMTTAELIARARWYEEYVADLLRKNEELSSTLECERSRFEKTLDQVLRRLTDFAYARGKADEPPKADDAYLPG